jgi:hypothetical protein
MTVHDLYSVVLNDTADVTLGGIASMNVRTQSEYRGEATSGEVYPRHQAIVAIKPIADFSSYCVADCLDAIGLIGKSITAMATGLELHAYAHVHGGGRAGASLHRKYTIADGMIVPDKITCDHRGDALISYKVLTTWDGTNAPIVELDLQSVPTAGTDDERFTIGKCTLGSVVVTDIRNWELDFGINAVTEGADSDIYDTHVSIVECKPVLTLKGIDIEWLKAANIPLVGKAATHATTKVYLRKRLQTAAGYVADATAEHIQFTMDGLTWIEDVFTSSGKGPTECSLKLAMRYDGTNAPFVVDTTCAIT